MALLGSDLLLIYRGLKYHISLITLMPLLLRFYFLFGLINGSFFFRTGVILVILPLSDPAFGVSRRALSADVSFHTVFLGIRFSYLWSDSHN